MRDKRQRAMIGGNGCGQLLLFVQHVAEIEKCERILRVHFGGVPVQPLGGVEVAFVVVDRAQVDCGSGVIRLHLQNGDVDRLGLVQPARNLFQPHRMQEHVLHLSGFRPAVNFANDCHAHAGLQFEVEGHLPRHWIDQRAPLPKGDSRSLPHRNRL